MYGYGDVNDPNPESVDLLEELVQIYISDLVRKKVIILGLFWFILVYF